MYQVLDVRLLKIPGTVEELAPLAREYGFDGLDVPEAILGDEKKADSAQAAMKENGLKWGLLPTPVDFFDETIDEKKFEEALEIQKRWAQLGEKIGVKYAYNHIWPSSSREFDENFEWHVKRLEKLQEVFVNHGIQYGFEFLGPKELRVRHPHPFVHTISGVLSIADAAGGKTGFLFDTYHWYCGNGRLDDLYFAAQNCHRMVNFHLNDGVAGKSRDEQEDQVRAMPMTTGIIDAARIYQLFEKNGYEGPVMCEPMAPSTDRFAVQDVEKSMAEVKDAFNRCSGIISTGRR